jgi:hypothetical protein
MNAVEYPSAAADLTKTNRETAEIARSTLYLKMKKYEIPEPAGTGPCPVFGRNGPVPPFRPPGEADHGNPSRTAAALPSEKPARHPYDGVFCGAAGVTRRPARALRN